MTCLPCAIEMEPKTLNPGQINHAREQAEAIQKTEPKIISDAIDQEMEPNTKDEIFNDGRIGESIVDECTKDEKIKMCLCTTIFIQSPEDVSHVEPLTAPF